MKEAIRDIAFYALFPLLLALSLFFAFVSEKGRKFKKIYKRHVE